MVNKLLILVNFSVFFIFTNKSRGIDTVLTDDLSKLTFTTIITSVSKAPLLSSPATPNTNIFLSLKLRMALLIGFYEKISTSFTCFEIKVENATIKDRAEMINKFSTNPRFSFILLFYNI